MCPKSQKKDKKFYRTFWRFCVLPTRKTIRVSYQQLTVLYRTLKVSYFLTEPFFCCAEPKKKFCKRWFCEWVKRRTFKNFCRIFYPFFETLDTFRLHLVRELQNLIKYHLQEKKYMKIPTSIRRVRERSFLIVFDSFGSDRITAVFHRIVNDRVLHFQAV
jgi:hypothetical protein